MLSGLALLVSCGQRGEPLDAVDQKHREYILEFLRYNSRRLGPSTVSVTGGKFVITFTNMGIDKDSLTRLFRGLWEDARNTTKSQRDAKPFVLVTARYTIRVP